MTKQLSREKVIRALEEAKYFDLGRIRFPFIKGEKTTYQDLIKMINDGHFDADEPAFDVTELQKIKFEIEAKKGEFLQLCADKKISDDCFNGARKAFNFTINLINQKLKKEPEVEKESNQEFGDQVALRKFIDIQKIIGEIVSGAAKKFYENKNLIDADELIEFAKKKHLIHTINYEDKSFDMFAVIKLIDIKEFIDSKIPQKQEEREVCGFCCKKGKIVGRIKAKNIHGEESDIAICDKCFHGAGAHE